MRCRRGSTGEIRMNSFTLGEWPLYTEERSCAIYIFRRNVGITEGCYAGRGVPILGLRDPGDSGP